jgi:methylated-DNA-[protein]-cysteine S-methyltransferase
MTIQTPFGPIHAAVDADGALTELKFGSSIGKPNSKQDAASNPLVEKQLNEFFAGKRRDFDLPLAPQGTDFQKRVWAELIRIPYGETISYAELARRVGSDGAARAVGRANATNPIAIIVPCHRVIGANGSLTGYAYGMEMKRGLLDFERGQSRSGLSHL